MAKITTAVDALGRRWLHLSRGRGSPPRLWIEASAITTVEPWNKGAYLTGIGEVNHTVDEVLEALSMEGDRR